MFHGFHIARLQKGDVAAALSEPAAGAVGEDRRAALQTQGPAFSPVVSRCVKENPPCTASQIFPLKSMKIHNGINEFPSSFLLKHIHYRIM